MDFAQYWEAIWGRHTPADVAMIYGLRREHTENYVHGSEVMAMAMCPARGLRVLAAACRAYHDRAVHILGEAIP